MPQKKEQKVKEKKKKEEKQIIKEKSKTIKNPVIKPKKEKKAKKKNSWFKGIIAEMKKVKWPTGKEMIKYTIATLVFSLFFGLLFYGLYILFAFVKELIA